MKTRERYANFRVDLSGIHPLKRLMRALSLWVSGRARFAIFGLPGRATDTGLTTREAVTAVVDGTATSLGAILDAQGDYLAELTAGAGPFIESRFLKRQRCFPRVTRRAGTVVSLVNDGDLNYYRWLMETLPRLRFLEEDGGIQQCFYARQREGFHRESLRSLVGGDVEIMSSDEAPFLRAERLVVPRLVMENEEWIIRWLRGKILPLVADKTPEIEPRRIYVTRRKATGRRVANEAELAGLLAEFDFAVVSLEELSWLEQVELFRGAEAVAGAHGAGLANLVFAGRSTRVLEFIAADYPFTFYPEISGRLGMEHHCVWSEPTARGRIHSSDLVVPLTRVREILERALG